MNVNGHEVDFKITRVQDSRQYQKALQIMDAAEKDLVKRYPMNQPALTFPTAEFYEAYIRIISDFFVNCLGSNVLEGCDDIEEAQRVYLDFVAHVKRQSEDVYKNIAYPIV